MVDTFPAVRGADPRQMTDIADVLIVGGGLAGGALATRLASAGRDVLLLEREAGPHDKVCGEFLSREAVLYLNALGVDPLALGAERIDAVRLSCGPRVATVALPFPALSLSRRLLDDALLSRAAGAGATVRKSARVQALEPDKQGWRARLADGTDIAATNAFLATGKHDLRGWSRPAGPQPDMIGFKQYWRLTPDQAAALAGHVELTLFPGGYAGLEPVEGGRANLCLVVRRSRFAALGQHWRDLLGAILSDSPLLARRLAGADPCLDRPLAIASIPYGYIRRAKDGLWRLGDQMAVIPSFSGDGMSIALHSAELAAESYLAGHSAEAFQARLSRDVATQVRLATALSLGLVRRPTQLVLSAAARLFPALVTTIASRTRVSDAALARTELALAG